jgi:Transposase
MDHNNAVYGVDVSKAKLVIARYDVQTLAEVGNGPESIAAWLAGLPRGAVVAMEATGIYHRLLAHLAHAAGMRVYVLNPQTLKHYAQAIGRRGKTDNCDARMIARYAVHEQAKLRRWQPPARRAPDVGPEPLGPADAQGGAPESVGEPGANGGTARHPDPARNGAPAGCSGFVRAPEEHRRHRPGGGGTVGGGVQYAELRARRRVHRLHRLGSSPKRFGGSSWSPQPV